MSEDFKLKAVRDYLRAQIGAPVVGVIDSELGAIQTAINLALLLYWQAFPHIYTTSLDDRQGSNINVNIEDMMDEIFPDQLIRDNAYFLGVARMDMNAGGIAGGANINSYLLGMPMYATNSSYSSTGGFNSTVDVTELVRYQTEVGSTMGVPEIQWDPTTGGLTFITPYSYGQLTLGLGFGFSEAAGLKYLRTHQLDLFRKMTAMEFINIIENARGQIVLSADYTLDMSKLAKRRQELKDEVEKAISDQMIYPMGWG
jgi:hypothetical protein